MADRKCTQYCGCITKVHGNITFLQPLKIMVLVDSEISGLDSDKVDKYTLRASSVHTITPQSVDLRTKSDQLDLHKRKTALSNCLKMRSKDSIFKSISQGS